MRKNMISVIILALVIVNIVLTAVMMFSVTSTNKKTSEMVLKIASATDMELSGMDGTAPASQVAMEDIVTYDIADTMTIPLKKGDDGKEYYMMIAVTLSMDSNNKGYNTYGETIADKESLIKSEIIDVVGSYTIDEARADISGMQDAILERIQEMFGSDFVFDVNFSDVKYSG